VKALAVELRSRALAHFARAGHAWSLLSPITNESIDHDADVSVTDTPVIGQWTTFAAKSETFDQSRGGYVIRMDQSFDPMNVEFVDTVLEHRSNDLCPKAVSLMLRRNDVTQFEASVPGISMVIVDHANALIVLFPADCPGEVVIGACRLAEPPKGLVGLRHRLAGPRIPEPHRILITEAGV
jgi:hypothetical protein